MVFWTYTRLVSGWLRRTMDIWVSFRKENSKKKKKIYKKKVLK